MPHHLLKHGFSAVSVGSDYTPEEIEFLVAMDRYMRRQGSNHPTWPEVLRVAKSLGYRKVDKPEGK